MGKSHHDPILQRTHLLEAVIRDWVSERNTESPPGIISGETLQAKNVSSPKPISDKIQNHPSYFQLIVKGRSFGDGFSKVAQGGFEPPFNCSSRS